MKKLAIVAAAAMLAAPAAFAAGPSGMIAGYLTNSGLDIEGFDDDSGTGFGLKGWAMVTGPVFVHGEYQTTELELGGEKGDLESLRLGGGYYAELSPQTGLIGKVEYVDAGSDVDQDGFGIHGGILFHATPEIHLSGTLGYLSTSGGDFDTDGLEINVGAGYSFTKEFGGFIDYRTYQGSTDPGSADFEVNDLRAGVSYMFGG